MFICGFDGSAPVIKALAGSPVRATGALDAVKIGEASVNATINAIGKGPTKINFPYVLSTSRHRRSGRSS